MDLSLTVKTPRARHAFTIIELLVVIAIIGILAGIFFGVANGVRERARISRAQAELSLLAQYLEQYKGQYGDYPRVTIAHSNSAPTNGKREGEDAAERLYNALNGMRGVSHIDSEADFGSAADRQRAFIDRSKFHYRFTPSLVDRATEPADPETEPAVLVDPWGNLYRYYYAPEPVTTSWENRGYVLYSKGPSGEHEPLPANTDGYPERDHDSNRDTIYAN